jgi:hypothetical protein
MSQATTFEHIGAARQYEGTLRIDIKTMQAVVARSDVARLLDRWPVDVFDISDVMKTAGNPSPVGRAWVTRSGKAVMYMINGIKYISPLAQVKGAITGERKYANVSIMREIAGLPALSSSSVAEVAA